jgi:hypothetical protein
MNRSTLFLFVAVLLASPAIAQQSPSPAPPTPQTAAQAKPAPCVPPAPPAPPKGWKINIPTRIQNLIDKQRNALATTTGITLPPVTAQSLEKQLQPANPCPAATPKPVPTPAPAVTPAPPAAPATTTPAQTTPKQ